MKISAFLLLALSVVLVALPTRTISAASAPGVVTTQPARKVNLAYLALSRRTRFAVENYLRTDCEVGEVGKALLALLPFSKKATPYLKAVRQEGPPTLVIRALNRGLKHMFLLLVCGRLITLCLFGFSTMREFGLSGYKDAAAWEVIG